MIRREKKKDSDEESEEVKDTKKKKKAESDEEVDETSSSEKQVSPNKSKPLSGMVIALSGKLSMTSDEIKKLIEKKMEARFLRVLLRTLLMSFVLIWMTKQKNSIKLKKKVKN